MISEILKSCGYPTDTLVIDFETYTTKDYRLGRGRMSTVEYIKDPRFQVLGVAIKKNNDSATFLDYATFTDELEAGRHRLENDTTVICHNAMFDCGILAFRYGIYPYHVIDTLSLARHVDSRNQNDLAHLAKRLKIGEKGDSSWAIGLTWEQMTAEQQRQMTEYSCNDAELEHRIFRILLLSLSWPDIELRLMQHTLELYTRPQLRIDRDRADEIKQYMGAKMMLAAYDVCMTPTELRQNSIDGLFFMTLQQTLGNEKIPLKCGKKKMIPALGKDDEALKRLQSHSNQKVRDLVNARLAIKSWPLHIKRVESLVAQSKAMDGLLPIPLKYYGGHTGRWSGTEGINPQNFGTRSKENLVNQVRTIIVPPPDHVLLITDAAQIEARIVNWLAGQWNILDLYASGADPYCKLAAAIIGRPVNKPDSMRQLGKCAELGCGFGMGPTKFMAMAAKPPYNLTVAPHQSEVAIYAYRQTHPKVVTLWYNVERGFKYVAKNPIEKFALPIGVSSHVLFTSLNGVISVRLPSSRVLYYPKIRIRVEQNREELVQLNATDTRKSVRLWGGFLVENIVQAIARDILALAILETDKYGAGIGQRVALSVHDEIVSVAPEKYAAMALDIQLAALRHTPEWAEGLPLNAEGKTAERYEK